MEIRKNFERVNNSDWLTRLEVSGSPEEFTKKFGMEQRWLYKMISELINTEGLIEFDKDLDAYLKKCSFEFSFSK
ncbi:MAG: hypothetical protein HY738_09485 [Bacteroidia bacterium]|nr:hypothetical protein [Bacteroidia bacterium]